MKFVARITPLLLLIFIVILIFHQLALSSLILARGDTYNYFYPYWTARNLAMQSGELPLWTSHIFMGAPLLANPQLGTFYPLNWLTIPFDAPTAIRISVLIHVAIASIGAYALAYKTLPITNHRQVSALITGMTYGLGGYVGAHIEQINQLQGLAWLPILFLCLHQIWQQTDRSRWFYVLLLAICWALQISTGHTQTVFIAGVGLGIYSLWMGMQQPKRVSGMVWAIGFLLIASILALVLMMVQILPTLELTGMSNREGGFTAQEATAFSLIPTYIGRSLLPAYSGQLFGEYVAYLGVIALGFAFLSIFAYRTDSRTHLRWLWMIIAGIALFFAFGRANPIYVMLAELPGFNLFRVPARWMALFALAMAWLSGYGVQQVLNGWRPPRITLALTSISIIALILIARFVPIDPLDVNGSAIPTNTEMLAWGIAFVILFSMIFIPQSLYQWRSPLIVLLIVGELFLASRIMPYNDLTPTDVYTEQRFTISQLQALQAEHIAPSRYLSISPLFFDVGDVGTLQPRYEALGMNERGIRNALVALKKQEVAFPNQSLTFGIDSVDGFGGGILPLMQYTQFTAPILPPDRLRAVDGRLGEILAQEGCRGACIPDERYLDLMDVRYLIIDKVFDIWHEDVAYDVALPQTIVTDETIVYSGASVQADAIHIITQGQGEPLIMNSMLSDTVDLGDGLTLWRFALDTNEARDNITIQTNSDTLNIIAVSAVNTYTSGLAFNQWHPEGWRRVLSSDIKLYERTSPYLGKAYFTSQIETLPGTWQGREDALSFWQNDVADVHTTIIHGLSDEQITDGDTIHQALDMTSYTQTSLELTVTVDEAGYVIIKDAHYPHWQATLNGESVPIYRANVMQRAVYIPSAGTYTLTMTFAPQLWQSAQLISVIAWGIILVVMGWLGLRRS